MIDAATLSEASSCRIGIAAACEDRLRRHARSGLAKENPADFVIVCILVDTQWRAVVDHLMPNHDWESIRASGMTPVATGLVRRKGMRPIVLDALPDLEESYDGAVSQGSMPCVVLDDTGGAVIDVVAYDN